MSYLVSWSGGKDGCHACYRAIQKGFKISYLMNSISDDKKKVRFHGSDPDIIRMQSEAIGIPAILNKTRWNEYEEDFKNAIKKVIPEGIKGMVFGDIYVEEHLTWVERVCGEIGIEAVEPLWGESTETLIRDFIDAGFKATIVTTNAKYLGKEWIGRSINNEFINYLLENDIDPCGEKGEYHTIVTDGPMFKKRIQLSGGTPVSTDGYWILDSPQFSLVEK